MRGLTVVAGLLALVPVLLAPVVARADAVDIIDVRVVGDDSLPVDIIDRLVTNEIGSSIDEAKLARVTKRLDELGFLRAELELVPGADGDVLEVRLIRLPFVTDVSFEGLFPIFNRTALNALQLRPGDVLDREILDDEVGRLVAVAEREGFFGTRCAYVLEPDEENIAILYRCERGRLLSPRIEVTGASVIPAAEVRDALSSWLYFTRESLDGKVEDLTERYRELGHVRARIRVAEVTPHPEEGFVEVRVEIEEERELVLSFEGNRALDDDDLRELLPFVEEGGHGFFLAEEGADAIRAAYQADGFPEAQVDFERRPGDERVEVLYTIEEGERADLEAVRFRGNAQLSSRELRSVITSMSPRWLVLAPRWSRERLEADRFAVEERYRERGFARARVEGPTLEKQEGADGPSVTARFEVTEGLAHRLVSVEVVGVPADIAEDLEAARTLRPGQPYRQSALRGQELAFEKVLQASGYLTGQVDRSEVMDGRSGDVEARFEILSGPPLPDRTGAAGGPPLHLSVVIDDAIEVREGRILTPAALAETQDNLRNLEVFDSIRLRPLGLSESGAVHGLSDPDPADAASVVGPKIPVVIQMRESDRMQLDVGFGYDSDRGAAVRFTGTHGNLLGRAVRVSARGTLGQRDREAALTFAYPRLLGCELTASLSAAYDDRDLEAFDEEEFTLGSGLTREFDWDLVGRIGLSYRLADVTNVTGEDPDAPEPGFSRALLWQASLVRDTRDNVLYPGRGSYLALAMAVSSTELVSDDDFVRIDVQARRYWTLMDEVVAVIAGRFTDVELYGRTDTVPTPELLFAGGASSVRGFEEDRLGPLDSQGEPLGGGTRVIANAELRFPLFWILDGAAFMDAGSVVRELESLSLDRVSVIAGGGIRARSPVGPIRFDLGYQLEENEPLDRWAFHFSFGFPF